MHSSVAVSPISLDPANGFIKSEIKLDFKEGNDILMTFKNVC